MTPLFLRIRSSRSVEMFTSVLGGPRQFSLAEAALAGWAPDGGMFWTSEIPRVSPSTLVAWAGLSYRSLCAAVLKLFVPAGDPDLSHAEIDAIVGSAFDSFGSPHVVEVRPLGPADESLLFVAELWHGPTLAFKDLGMSVLGRTLSHLLQRRHERLTLLVGTSGDTGSSANETPMRRFAGSRISTDIRAVPFTGAALPQ